MVLNSARSSEHAGASRSAWPSDLSHLPLDRDCDLFSTLRDVKRNIKTYIESPNQLAQPSVYSRPRARFSNTSRTATCSPSPQAGSGSACELQPSEREPPLQREDKEKDSKQEGSEGESSEPHQLVATIRPEPPRANKSTKADHAATETETGVWRRWDDCREVIIATKWREPLTKKIELLEKKEIPFKCYQCCYYMWARIRTAREANVPPTQVRS